MERLLQRQHSEEPLLGYAAEHITFGQATLHPAETRLGRYSEREVIGRVGWSAHGVSPALLRVVNALVDYAEHCGTEMKTALGMGQTRASGPGVSEQVGADVAEVVP